MMTGGFWQLSYRNILGSKSPKRPRFRFSRPESRSLFLHKCKGIAFLCRSLCTNAFTGMTAPVILQDTNAGQLFTRACFLNSAVQTDFSVLQNTILLMNNIINEQTYRQLGRYLSRECSRTEARAVEAWAQGNPQRKSLLVGMRTLWESRGQAPPQWDADAGWQELDKLLERARYSIVENRFTKSPFTGLRSVSQTESNQAQHHDVRYAEHVIESGHRYGRPASEQPANVAAGDTRSSKRRSKPHASIHHPFGFRFWLVRAAAALLLVGFVTLLVRELAGPPDVPSGSLALREVATEPGQRVNLHLDDGTQVRMNAGSVLRMPGTFSDQVRMVHLSGEAYFEVTGDARPFVVATDRGQMIEVLGTEFNVKSYRDEPFGVVVSGGVVSVREVAGRPNDGQDGQYVLLPDELQESGQGIRIERGQMMTEQDGSVQVHHDVDLSRELAWLEHRLVFDDTPLNQVARELERWYRVKVVLSESAHGDLRVTATFENELPQEIFRSLSLSLNLDYDIEDGQVVFSRRP